MSALDCETQRPLPSAALWLALTSGSKDRFAAQHWILDHKKKPRRSGAHHSTEVISATRRGQKAIPKCS